MNAYEFFSSVGSTMRFLIFPWSFINFDFWKFEFFIKIKFLRPLTNLSGAQRHSPGMVSVFTRYLMELRLRHCVRYSIRKLMKTEIMTKLWRKALKACQRPYSCPPHSTVSFDQNQIGINFESASASNMRVEY